MIRISLDEVNDSTEWLIGKKYEGTLIAMHLYDETELNTALTKIDDQSLAVGVIYLDNYEETLETMDDVRRSL